MPYKMLCEMQLQGSSNSSTGGDERMRGVANGVSKLSIKPIKVEPQDDMPKVDWIPRAELLA